jgi:ERCC4-type nuclease
VILLDPRAGSQELLDPLVAAGLPVEPTTLKFGDISFVGRGEGGAPLGIGIEYKKLPDLVDSLNTDRLAGHQLGGMVTHYDRGYLIIEGAWDVDDSGRVVVPSKFKRMMQPLKGAPCASVLESRVWTLEHRGGLHVRWTQNQKETVRAVSTLYRCWTDRDLDEHRSHLAIHAPDLDRALGTPITLRRRIAAVLPHIGYTLSAAVEKHFPSIWRMMNAEPKEWMEIDGIGKKTANDIVNAIRKETKPE